MQVRNGDASDQIELYVFALDSVSFYAMDLVVSQAIRGCHPKLSRKFAPTTAELGEAIAEVMAGVVRQNELAEEKLKIADNRPVARRAVLIEERIQIARQKMADEGRKLLQEVDSHAAGQSVARRMPVGAVYNGILCAWYGPPGSLHAATAPVAQPEPVEPELPVDEVFDLPPSPPVEAYADVEF